MYTIDRNTALTDKIILEFVRRHHNGAVPRLTKLDAYYRGEHDILHRSKMERLSNNRLVCNHAKHITDMASGYLVGNPITYQSEADISALTDWLCLADAETADMDIAKDASIFGRAYELVYMSDEPSPTPRLSVRDPRGAFVVYDDTVERRPVFGVYYYPVYTVRGELKGYRVNWYTDGEQRVFSTDTGFGAVREPAAYANPFGAVPLVEYSNNEEQQGDFEQVISLIDAYNVLQSDRVNDKEQFVAAILLIKGQVLGDSDAEESAAYKALKAYGILELDATSSAEWLTRTFDETSVEVLRRALEEDIHRFSGVPCLDDENFSGNVSGVAMRYKLLGFEQLTKIKERYFRAGLKRRMELFDRMLETKGGPAVDINQIDITFTRNLPVNELEQADIVQRLDGLVPREILLSILPFIKDPTAAADALKEEKKENARNMRDTFGNSDLPPDEEE